MQGDPREQRSLRRTERKTSADNAAHEHLHGLSLSSSNTGEAFPASSVPLLLTKNKRHADATTSAANTALVHLHSLPKPTSSSAEASLPSSILPVSSLVDRGIQELPKISLQPLALHQSHSRTPSRWDADEVHGWLTDKPYRSFLEGPLWNTKLIAATRTPVMLSLVGEPWTRWDGELLVLALSHPTSFLPFMGVHAIKFFCDMETLFASEADGNGRDVLRARCEDGEHAGGSMRTWTVPQVANILHDKQYEHKLRDQQWNGMHLYAALRFPGAFLEFMGADGVVLWRDLEMLAHGPPAEEAWASGRYK